MGDKSPPVCPGFALRSIASWKMPQTPFPVDPPTVHQGELSKSRQKGPQSPQLFQSFYLFFKFLSPILPESIMTKPYHFHKSNQLYTKISQGQIGKVLVALMHCPLPNIQLCIARVLHFATSFHSGNTDLIFFPRDLIPADEN